MGPRGTVYFIDGKARYVYSTACSLLFAFVGKFCFNFLCVTSHVCLSVCLIACLPNYSSLAQDISLNDPNGSATQSDKFLRVGKATRMAIEILALVTRGALKWGLGSSWAQAEINPGSQWLARPIIEFTRAHATTGIPMYDVYSRNLYLTI